MSRYIIMIHEGLTEAELHFVLTDLDAPKSDHPISFRVKILAETDGHQMTVGISIKGHEFSQNVIKLKDKVHHGQWQCINAHFGSEQLSIRLNNA